MTDLAQEFNTQWRDYLEMCKPRVVLLMLLCTIVGMFLASSTMVPWNILLFGSLGVALVAGSAAALNHLVDASIDAKMSRLLMQFLEVDRRVVAVGAQRAEHFDDAGLAGILLFRETRLRPA